LHPPGRVESPAVGVEEVIKAALVALLIAGCAATVAMAGMQRVSEMCGGERCSGAMAARGTWDACRGVGGANWGG